MSSQTTERYNTMSPIPMTLRGRHEVAPFFDGLEPVGPGLVSGTEWLTVEDSGHGAKISFGYSGIARRP